MRASEGGIIVRGCRLDAEDQRKGISDGKSPYSIRTGKQLHQRQLQDAYLITLSPNVIPHRQSKYI
jgi:hypothetical protein